MRTFFFTVCMTLISLVSYAQLPVTDLSVNAELIGVNTQLTTLNSALTTAISELTVINSQTAATSLASGDHLGLAQKIAEKTQKVTNVIRQLQNIERIINSAKSCVDSATDLTETLTNPVLDVRYVGYIAGGIKDLIYSLNNSVAATTTIIADFHFDMTDKERIDAINAALREVEHASMELNRLKRQTERMIEYRNLIKSF